MSTELALLTCTILLGLLHLLATVPFTIGQLGLRYTFSPRDEQAPLQGAGARANRAFYNFLETFPFFLAAVLVAKAMDRHNGLTLLGSQLYLGARLAYIPLYVAGIHVLRTLAWLVAVGGIALVLTGIL